MVHEREFGARRARLLAIVVVALTVLSGLVVSTAAAADDTTTTTSTPASAPQTTEPVTTPATTAAPAPETTVAPDEPATTVAPTTAEPASTTVPATTAPPTTAATVPSTSTPAAAPVPAAAPAVAPKALVAPAAADDDSTVRIVLTKTLVSSGPFQPGQPFVYRIGYSCSSLTDPCIGAKVVDTLPAPLAHVSHTATSHPSTITVDGQVITATFTQLVDADGHRGLQPGSTGSFDITVTFVPGTTDGTVAENCAVMSAQGVADERSCASATAVVPTTYGVTATKSFGTTSAVQGSGATSTVRLSATLGGNAAASSVVVEDPTGGTDPFDALDLTGFAPLSLPAGVQATVAVRAGAGYVDVGTYTNGQTPTLPGASGIDAADVTGIRITYSAVGGGTIPAGTTLSSTANVRLRDTLRSAPGTDVPVGAIHNCADATATYAGAPAVTDPDNCATFDVVTRTPGVRGTKTISPSSVQQGSGATVTMGLAATNTSNTPADRIVVTDPTNGTNPFNLVTFGQFNALSLPSGVTATVEVLVGGGYVTVGSGLTNGQTPVLPGSVGADQVTGVRYTYDGTIAVGATITNSFTTKLKDSTEPFASSAINCFSADLQAQGTAGATASNVCANLAVTPVSRSVQANKAFSPSSATAHTGATTTVTLQGRNTSNVPLTASDDFQLVEPGTGSGATFDMFDFVSFGQINAAPGTTWRVEVLTGGSTWTASPGTYAGGSTPTLPAGITADAVRGVRYTLVSGSLPTSGSYAQRGIDTSIVLALRNTNRTSGAAIDGGTLTNTTTASATGTNPSTGSATFTVNPINPGSGAGVGKSISPDSMVAGSGATANVTLNGRNGSNTTIDTIVITDVDSTFFGAFDFTSFGTATRPAGTTSLHVEWFDGTAWQNVGTYNGTGNVTPALPGGVSASAVRGVRFTWTGSFAPNANVVGRFNAQLRDSTAAGTVRNCQETRYDGALIDEQTFTACANVTVTAQTRSVDQSKSFSPAVGTAGVDPAATTTATLQVRNTSNVGIDSIVVTDPAGGTTPFDRFDLTGFTAITMPSNVRAAIEVDAGAGFVTVATGVATGGSVSLPGGIDPASVIGVRVTYTAASGTIAPQATMSVGLQLRLRDTVRGTTTPVTAGAIRNCFATTATTGAFTFTGNPCATYTVEDPSLGVADAKAWNPSSGVRDALPASTMTISGRNSGNVAVDSLSVQDPPSGTTVAASVFDAFDVTGLSGLVFPLGADRVQVDTLTADGTWHAGTPVATLPTLGSAATGGIAAADVVGVRATFTNSTGTLPVATAQQAGRIGIDVVLRATLRSTGAIVDVPAGGTRTFTNQSTATVTRGDSSTTAPPASATYTVSGGTVTIAPDKSLDDPAHTLFNPGDAVIYRLQIKNTGNRNLVDPVVVDRFPATLVYDETTPYPQGGFHFDANGSTLTGPPAATVAGQQVTFAFPAGAFLAPGQTAYVDIVLLVAPGTPAGTTIRNWYGVTADAGVNGDLGCVGATDSPFAGEPYCTDDEDISVQSSSGLNSVKEVRGVDGTSPTNTVTAGAACPDDGGYTRYPCVAHTVAGGPIDYRLTISNQGNTPADRAVLIDKLPAPGDTGVILGARGSGWQPSMISPITVSGLPAGAVATIYYSSVANPCTGALTGGAWCGDWSTSFSTSARAFGIDVSMPQDVLDPGRSFTLSWPMVAPGEATPGSIAWNSFAFSGRAVGATEMFIPAEPRKVGIVFDSPTLTVRKHTDPATTDGSFGFTLTPVDPAGDGETRTVTTDGGTGSASWTSLRPGGVYDLVESESPDSFAPGTFTCTDGSGAAIPTSPIDGGVRITLPAGGSVECSIANPLRPTITIDKTAVGGDGEFEFTLTPTDPDGDAQVRTVTTADGSGTASFGPAGLAVGGSFTLTETTSTPWVSTFVACNDRAADGAPIGTALTGDQVGVALEDVPAGAEIVCSFTNTSRPAITVAKTSVGGDGAFAFTLDGPGGSSTTVTTAGGTGTSTWGPDGLEVGGDYVLTEDVTDGWVSTFVGCVNAADGEATIGTALTDGRIGVRLDDVPAGARLVCSFTNTARPTVAVAKTVVGDADVDGFTFQLQGPTGGGVARWDLTSPAPSVRWAEDLTPGATYTLHEWATPGWQATFNGCTGATDVSSTIDGIGDLVVTMTLPAGADVTCSITNTADVPPPTAPTTTLVGADEGPAVTTPPGSLPTTGADAVSIVVLAVLALGGGALLVLVARRRRHRTA